MKEYVFITIWIGAIILFTILYIKYRNKIKNFERTLSNDVVKTRFNVSNRNLYKDQGNSLTIVLNAVPWKVDRLEDFVYERTLKTGKTTFLFDLTRKKCAMFNDNVKQKIITRLFDQYLSYWAIPSGKNQNSDTRRHLTDCHTWVQSCQCLKTQRNQNITHLLYFHLSC